MTDTMIPESIALVDFLHMLTVNVKQVLSDPKADPSIAVGRTLKQLAAVRSSCAHTVVCLDSPPYWRKQIYADYKGKRSEREPEWKPLMQATLERVHLDGYNVARAPNEEADDVVATLARIYSVEYGCPDVRIIGADKDALQCTSDRVRCFVPKGDNEFDIRGPEWLLKELKVTPQDFPLLLAIMGDDSDNIPGIQGLGKVNGAKLINIYKTPEGMAAGLVAAQNDAELNSKALSAVWKNYAAGMAQLPLWLKLTTLNTDARLDLHPLKYLEKLPMQKLAPEPSDADDSEFYDVEQDFQGEAPALDSEGRQPDWEAVAAATAERERAELAKALPVESQRSAADRQVAAARAEPLVGTDPNAADILAKAAAEREAEKLERLKAEAHARIASGQTDPATGKVEGFTPPGTKPPKAPAPASTAPAPAAAAAISAGGAPSEVVPKTQGPQVGERLAVVPVPAPSWALGTQPRSPTEMAQCAARFFNSRFYSAAHGNENGTFAVIALGRELGLGMAASVEGFHIITSGGVARPFPKANMLKALAEKDPNCEWIMITSADDKHATIKTVHRKVGPLEYTYDIGRAEKAGYLTGPNKHNWLTKTQEMLEARATSKAVRRWYPGATFGMHSQEEALDD